MALVVLGEVIILEESFERTEMEVKMKKLKMGKAGDKEEVTGEMIKS